MNRPASRSLPKPYHEASEMLRAGTENSQMLTPPRLLASSSLMAAASIPEGWAFARNLRRPETMRNQRWTTPYFVSGAALEEVIV